MIWNTNFGKNVCQWYKGRLEFRRTLFYPLGQSFVAFYFGEDKFLYNLYYCILWRRGKAICYYLDPRYNMNNISAYLGRHLKLFLCLLSSQCVCYARYAHVSFLATPMSDVFVCFNFSHSFLFLIYVLAYTYWPLRLLWSQ